jgi:hypothetical protein
MRNLDAIINQLANEQSRTEHLLLSDIEAVKNEARLFFDKQAREADSFLALLSMRFDDITARVRDGYPKASEAEPDGSFPAIVQRRTLSDGERENILRELGDVAPHDPQG